MCPAEAVRLALVKLRPDDRSANLNVRPGAGLRLRSGYGIARLCGNASRSGAVCVPLGVLRHQPDDIGAGQFATSVDADALAVAQDGDAIRKLHCFGEAVRGIEYRFTLRPKIHHAFDQQFSIWLGQDRRRLVENHDLAGMNERAGDLREAQARHAERRRLRIRVEGYADLRKRRRDRPSLDPAQTPAIGQRAFTAQQNIPADGEFRHHQNILWHHRDAETRRLCRPE